MCSHADSQAEAFYQEWRSPSSSQDWREALQVGDVAKVLGKDWKSTKTEDKKPYEAKAEKDRARYEQAKRDYVQPGREEEEEDEEEEYED